MDFNLTEEQRLLSEGAKRYVRERYAFLDYRKLVTGAQGSHPHWQAFADMGWLALPLPEEHGGLGCSFAEIAFIMEELGRGLVLEPYLPNVVLCSRIIERAAPADLQHRLLPRMAEGKMFLALAHAEPGGRYGIEQPGTTLAARSGDGFTLRGAKTLVLAGPDAEVLIVSAVLDGGPALFAVDAAASGVVRRDYQVIDRTGASDVDFNDVKLGRDALIAAGTPAYDALDDALDRAALAVVAQTLGTMEAAIEVAAEHVRNRRQFGQPLGQFQAVQHMLADVFIELQETRSILYRGLAGIDADPATRRAAVSSAKAYAGQAGKQVCATAVQLHGGYGITDEFQVGHCYRKAVLLEKMFGDTMYHSERVAADMLPST